MFVVAFFSFLSVLLTYLEAKRLLPNGMKIGFFIMILLACIHYDYGNDYMNYLEFYHGIVSRPLDLNDITGFYTNVEPGWGLLYYCFKYLGGFFMMVAVLSILQNVIVYKVIKYFVPLAWRPLSVFIYCFSTELYLMNFSMMRQGLVVCVFLGLSFLIVRNRWLSALFLLLICCSIHKSALLLIPFAFWGFIRFVQARLLAFIFPIFLLFALNSDVFVSKLFFSILSIDGVSNYGTSYLNYDSSITFGIGYCILLLPFIFGVLYLYSLKGLAQNTNSQIVSLYLVYYLIIPFGVVISIVTRVGIYFTAYSIIAFPIICSSIRIIQLRKILLFTFIVMTLYGYFSFFYNPIWSASFTNFKTIFPILLK